MMIYRGRTNSKLLLVSWTAIVIVIDADLLFTGLAVGGWASFRGAHAAVVGTAGARNAYRNHLVVVTAVGLGNVLTGGIVAYALVHRTAASHFLHELVATRAERHRSLGAANRLALGARLETHARFAVFFPTLADLNKPKTTAQHKA